MCTNSVDGEVKLWDIRGGDAPLQGWDLFPQGLSAFDVHEQTEVFAAYVNFLLITRVFLLTTPLRTSSLSPSNWRSQRTEVRSLESKRAIGSLTASLTVPPPRESMTPFTPKSSSLAFHPREMVYGVGFWDGTGEWLRPCRLH